MQTTTSESLPRTIPELLENHTIQVQPQGYSMYPLFVPGRDSAAVSYTHLTLPTTSRV